MSDKIEHSYGVVPFMRTSKGETLVLLIHHIAGHWGFPKGHPNQGEEHEQTALREFAEETGILSCSLLNESPFIEEYTYTDHDGVPHRKQVTYFIGIVTDTPSSPIPENEIGGSAWCSVVEALRTITHRESRDVLEKALDAFERYVGDR